MLGPPPSRLQSPQTILSYVDGAVVSADVAVVACQSCRQNSQTSVISTDGRHERSPEFAL